MRNVFENEINNLNREILALKTEKQKRLSSFEFSKQIIHITLRNNGDYTEYITFKVSPQNNVNPLITWYVDIGDVDPVAAKILSEPGIKLDGFDEPLYVSFALDQHSQYASVDADVVFMSTSVLNIEEV